MVTPAELAKQIAQAAAAAAAGKPDAIKDKPELQVAEAESLKTKSGSGNR